MRRLLSWQGALACFTMLLALLAVVAFLPRLVYPPLSTADLRGVAGAATRITLQNARYQLQNDFRSELLQILAALFVVAGAAATWQQIRIAREGQITERFTRAIEHLGSDKLDIRLGGIYALERLALNSPADRSSITPILGAFVRGHAPWPVGSPDGPAHPTPVVDDTLPWLTHRAVDVQTAMHVLARRPGHTDEPKLFLSRVDLRKMQLSEAILTETYLRHSNLAGAWIPGAHLDRSEMADADLRKANLSGASMAHADLKGAHLQGADLRHADLRHADLRGANLIDALLEGADLIDVQADDTTTWPAGSARHHKDGQVLTNETGPTPAPDTSSATEAPG
jgi:hypothetical protein